MFGAATELRLRMWIEFRSHPPATLDIVRKLFKLNAFKFMLTGIYTVRQAEMLPTIPFAAFPVPRARVRAA